MKCFVTGATGFIGSNLVHELNRRGHEVVALIRPGSNTKGLEGARYTPVQVDLLDRKGLEKAMAGCDWCFHVAAVYALWMPDYREMYRVNVDGTRTVLEAAAAAGCRRIVYTSTVGCLAVRKRTKGPVRPVTEEEVAPLRQVIKIPYKHSKWLAEQVALEIAGKGAPVVIVNPSTPVGPRDVKPTPTGQMIVDFLRGRMTGYLETGLNLVHVQDVAVGHILAAEKGRVGQRYILGHLHGNWTLRQIWETLSRMTGKPAPRIRIPYWVAWLYACLGEWGARITGKPPRAPLAAVRMARYLMFFDPSKAVQELGLPQTPPEQALQDAVDWFQTHGYAGKES